MRKRKNKSLGLSFEQLIDELTKISQCLKKKTDGKAEQLLDDMLEYPSLTGVLPYHTYDPENQIFINKNSLGFMLELTPLAGANEFIVESLDECLRKKIPRKMPLQFTFIASKEIKNSLATGLKNEKWEGENSAHFNEISRAYYHFSALNQFDNGRGYRLTLRNYRLFMNYAEPKKGDLVTQIKNLSGLLKIIKSAMEGSFLFGNTLSPNELLQLIREISSVDMGSTTVSSDKYDEQLPIDEQCLEKNIQLTLNKDNIHVRTKQKDISGSTNTIINNYMIDTNPERAYLWRAADNIGSILSPSLMISCPFVVTFIIEIEDQAKVVNEVNTKFLDRKRKSESQLGVLIPSIKREAQELNQLRTKLDGGKSALAYYYYNITLFSKSEDEARVNEQDALNTYRNNGINLSSSDFMQFRNYLAMFPFMPHEGLWSDLKISNATNRSEVIQAVNLLPIVSDNRLAEEGLLAPSFRNQISFINLFNLGTDNYNCAICGTAGAGKSVIAQSLLYDVFNKEGRIWIIDLGDSYKNFCEIVGGEYWDAAKLKFNPFANISPHADSKQLQDTLSKISQLILVMADPASQFVDKVMENIIYDGVIYAYQEKKNKARIDDVVAYFFLERNKPIYQDKETLRHRMDELIVLLKKYTSSGVYGKYFNSDDPTVTSQKQLTVLELGALQGTPDLLAVVLYTLIISIDEYMYQSSRSVMKVCAIDEAWRLLSGSKRVADFIEIGYRTARKHRGSFITITQGLDDFTKSSAAEAAWNNSSIKIIAKQDPVAIKAYINKHPDLFLPHQESVLKSFGNAGQQKFSAFLLAFNGDMHPCRLFLDPLRRTLFSSTGEDFDYIQSQRKQGVGISEAIYQRAKIKFSQEMESLEQWIKERSIS